MLFYRKRFIIACWILLLTYACKSQTALVGDEEKQPTNWTKKELLFEDSGTQDWTKKWFLDGERAVLDNTPMGMYYSAGPEAKNDTCHAVLWTKETFEGNMLIEFDYTRADYSDGFVNIIYFHATGKGGAEYPEDISLWNEKRRVPSMRIYYRHMNAYHISYAVGKANGGEDYIRLRRYEPAKRTKLAGSEIPPDTFNSGLFKPFYTYHVQVARYKNTIEMHIQNKQDAQDHLTLRWDASSAPLCNKGRIGLRHMYTRSSIYKDFKVWRIQKR